MSDLIQYRPSIPLPELLCDEIREGSEDLLLFLQAYYEWLQTCTLIYTDVSGTFTKGETVTGSTSSANGIIKVVDTANNQIIVKRGTLKPFDLQETITGGSSSATATLNQIKDNVVRQTGKILEYRDPVKSVDKFVDFLKSELYDSFPKTMETDERFIAKKLRDFYRTKSNEDSYKFLFRILFDEDIELKYPGEDLLRVSDGKFSKIYKIRTEIKSDVFDFLNETIRGKTSEALGNVIDIRLVYIGAFQVAEMELALTSGSFAAEEEIEAVANTELTANTYGMITGFNIIDGGSGYSSGDQVPIVGDGNSAETFVSSIKKSPITALKINTVGQGYRLGVDATINNTGTGGTGLEVSVKSISNTYTVVEGANTYTLGEIDEVAIVARGKDYAAKPVITLVDTTISALGMLSDKLITIVSGGSNYQVGDALVFTGGAGANAAGNVASVSEYTTYDLQFEDGGKVLIDGGSIGDKFKNEDWSVSGAITRIELTNFGRNYTSANLPLITVTSGSGAGANLIATNIQGVSANVEVDIANNQTGVGSIRSIEVRNPGILYTTATANTLAIGDGNANVVPIVSGLSISDGLWINDEGKIDYKIIQDSYYWQDFSYVIRSGLVIQTYSDIVKRIIHPAGTIFFGEILLVSELNVTPRMNSIIELVQNIEDFYIYITSLVDASLQNVSVNSIEKEVLLESAITGSTDTFDEYNLEIQIEANTSPVPLDEYRLEIQLQANTSDVSAPISETILSPIIQSANAATNYIAPFVGTYGDARISEFASVLISSLSSITFDTEYLKSIRTFSKSSGTVNVSSNIVYGTGTSFTSDFSPGSYFVVENEKFIVLSVANSTYMELNVPAQTTYTNVFAYY